MVSSLMLRELQQNFEETNERGRPYATRANERRRRRESGTPHQRKQEGELGLSSSCC